MSTLLVLGYPNEEQAKVAYNEILNLNEELIVDLQSIAVVAKKDGKYDVVTPTISVGTSTVWGLFWGVLFGMIFFMPLIGAAVGAGFGALAGVITKSGVDQDFQNRVRDKLTDKDSAAVFMITREITTDKFVEALKPIDGDVLQTSLSVEDEEELKHALLKG